MIAEAGASRPGGRTARVRSDVLAAVESELAEHGYDGLTVDAVAVRSGVRNEAAITAWVMDGRAVSAACTSRLTSIRSPSSEPVSAGSHESSAPAASRSTNRPATVFQRR